MVEACAEGVGAIDVGAVFYQSFASQAMARVVPNDSMVVGSPQRGEEGRHISCTRHRKTVSQQQKERHQDGMKR